MRGRQGECGADEATAHDGHQGVSARRSSVHARGGGCQRRCRRPDNEGSAADGGPCAAPDAKKVGGAANRTAQGGRASHMERDIGEETGHRRSTGSVVPIWSTKPYGRLTIPC